MFLSIIIMMYGNPTSPEYTDHFTTFLKVDSIEECLEASQLAGHELVRNPDTPFWNFIFNCHAIEDLQIIEKPGTNL